MSVRSGLAGVDVWALCGVGDGVSSALVSVGVGCCGTCVAGSAGANVGALGGTTVGTDVAPLPLDMLLMITAPDPSATRIRASRAQTGIPRETDLD